MPEIPSLLPLLMLLLPFMGFAMLSACCRLLPRNGDWMAISLLLASMLLSGWLFQSCWWGGGSYTGALDWITVGEQRWSFAWNIDRYSSLMLLVVTFVTMLVMVFSTAYMKGDKNYGRYFSYLCLFSGAMMGLVMVDHLLLLYVFWELVGLASYLLIGFWQEKPSAARASKKAFLVNRIGDAGFLIGLLAVYQLFGTLEVSSIIDALTQNGGEVAADDPWLLVAGAGISMGALAKSAQLPFSIWLPDAMEGPTPVSALLHAATMVAAGVYMLARLSPLLVADVQSALLVLGGLTAFFGAFAALFQRDLKKVLAYSTISQLGYMFMGIGANVPEVAMFHLLTHAFFKASLFLGAGSIIHALHAVADRLGKHFDAQDMQLMGGLKRAMPKTFIAVVISGMALAGLPLFSGFLSKDALLASVWRMTDTLAWPYLPLTLGLMAALMTAFYIGRFILLIFFGEWRNEEISITEVEEVDLSMYAPVFLLSAGALWILFSWNPLDAGNGWFLGVLLPDMVHDAFNTWTGITTTILALIGLFIAYQSYGRTKARSIGQENGYIHKLSKQAFYLDAAYTWCVKYIILTISELAYWWDKRVVDRSVNLIGVFGVTLAHLSAGFDRYIIDGLVRLIAASSRGLGQLSISFFHQGKVQGYLAAMLLGLLALWFFL